MDIIDGVKKLVGQEIIRVTSDIKQQQGSAVQCGAALEQKVTVIMKNCDATFYDQCSPKLDEIGQVCPALGTEIKFESWRNEKMLEKVNDLKCTVDDLRGNLGKK